MALMSSIIKKSDNKFKMLAVFLFLIVTLSGLQMSNCEHLNDDIRYENSSNLSSSIGYSFGIRTLLDVFSMEHVSLFDKNFMDNTLGTNCSGDISTYIEGLKENKLWAIKMDDASGHYSSGFLYGNSYWMGSLSLCRSIKQQNNSNKVFLGRKKSDNLPFSNHINDIFSSSNGTQDVIPFQTAFFVLKIALNHTRLNLGERLVNLGLCLPSTCAVEGVKNFVISSQEDKSPYQDFNVVSIRSVTSHSYSFWTDSTFIILLIVTIIVSALLVIGTIAEVILSYRRKQAMKESHKELANSETSSGIGCTTYDLTNIVPEESTRKDITCDITLGKTMSKSVNNNNSSDENLAEKRPKKSSIALEVLLSFSVITNFNAICDRRVGVDTIPSIHGLRALSMAWVVLGHTCIIVFKYSDNMEYRKVVEKEFLFQTITNGAFSVDTFFFISGFLVSYIYFRTNAKGKLDTLSKGVSEITAGTFHFFGLIFYRFVRLTAPYLFALGVVEVLMKHLSTASVFDPPTMDHVNCPKYWWRNVLYINTLFPVEEMCMLWSWYLADDTQFYIIGALILIIAVRHFKLAASILTTFMISSWATTAYIAFANNHMPNTDDPLALFDKIYDKPWTRLGPYLIGMCVGWILFKTNCKIKMTKKFITLGWLASIICLLLLIFGLYNRNLSLFTAAAYSSLSHSAWALSLAWIIIACSTGHGGWINDLLSAPCIYPFSRVTYCAYLVHPIVIRYLVLNSDSPLHLGANSMVVTFFGLLLCSYFFSFVLSISFEAPVVTMLKIMSPNRKKRLA